MWNGHPSNDRRLVTMDLGLAVSNDALHYPRARPRLSHRFPPPKTAGRNCRTAIPWSTIPHLIQGQGFEQVGDETLYWYAPWPEQSSDGVRVASWPRDRLGYLPAISRRAYEARARFPCCLRPHRPGRQFRAALSEYRWLGPIQLRVRRSHHRTFGADTRLHGNRLHRTDLIRPR